MSENKNKYPILTKINSPADLKALPESVMPELCFEIRRFLVENVRVTGGHLASNLGVVELTVAMHRVFSSPCDRYFTLDDKIRLALDTMMKAYDIPEDDRKATLEKVLAKDYEQMARDMFDKFVKRLDNDIEKNE